MMDGGEESWTTGHFDATLLSGSLRVGHIPANALCKCTHALVKLLVLDAEESDSSSMFMGEQGAVLSPPERPRHTLSAGSGIDDLLNGSAGLLDMEMILPGQTQTAEQSGVNVMLVQDSLGVTVIVNDRYYRHLQLSGVVEHMRWAPSPWRALQIHLGPASADAPGIISYLSSMLSERNVSILNFSTFEADLILVQEFDLKKARELLVECGRDGVCGLKEQIAEKRLVSKATEESKVSLKPRQAGGAGKLRSNSTSSETISAAYLAVVQTPLVLASIKRLMLKQSMFSLMKQIVRNVDVQLLAQQQQQLLAQKQTTQTAEDAAEASAAGAASLSVHDLRMRQVAHDYLWAYFSTNEEISLLLDERDLKDFPEDSLVVCPQRWKAIRLLGKDIPFDETGIVHIMSSPYEVGVQLLNMSTYSTNVSLVAEDDVEAAIDRLRLELNGRDTKVYGNYISSSSPRRLAA